VSDYAQFIAGKHATTPDSGFSRRVDPDSILFPFQRQLVEWAWLKGRAALFADTGLGKTPMQLTWADGVVNETGRPVLILGPLAVVRQTEAEAVKFGIDGVAVVRDSLSANRIQVCNFEMAKHLDFSAYAGVVIDESSILKNAFGRYRRQLIEWCADVPYRLACSATPSPNDHTELGNHSEWLSVMDHAVMKARWFLNDLGDTVQPWRLKRHAVDDFWRWVATWARCVSKPSDVGDYDDSRYDLPPLRIEQHVVSVDIVKDAPDGMLFRVPEMSATSIHREKRRTLDARVRMMVDLVNREPDEPWVIWCETNDEQDAAVAAIPGIIDVRGSMTPSQKADGLLAFAQDGGCIVTKPKIAGMGLNWQHSARAVFLGGSYSFEQFYQALRRQYRFGQPREVHAHVIMASTERRIWQAIHRKAGHHERMRVAMLEASRKAAREYTSRLGYQPSHLAPVPLWLRSLTTLGEK